MTKKQAREILTVYYEALITAFAYVPEEHDEGLCKALAAEAGFVEDVLGMGSGSGPAAIMRVPGPTSENVLEAMRKLGALR